MNRRIQKIVRAVKILYFRECHWRDICKSFANTGLVHKKTWVKDSGMLEPILSLLDLTVKYSGILCAGC